MNDTPAKTKEPIKTLAELGQFVEYSFMDALSCGPDAKEDGNDHLPRQVFSGHYVPVRPTAIKQPLYVAHSKQLFHELGFDDCLAKSNGFMKFFSGDFSQLPDHFRKTGWATGYALSIYGTEYTEQCPFQTGNGYGDGRAISVVEVFKNQKRYEMQLKGGGKTPYCRGGDGRAVLRSSVREFLAQEHMHALGVPTSRSLSLYVSKTERVTRPWYSQGATSQDPDLLVCEPVAITTRVAPSFIRVGQLELFARRARANKHPHALAELEQLALHLIEREYANDIDPSLSLNEKLLLLAQTFRDRLASLIAGWIRVGYCQGNFNSDNCAAGGFTLDYGPFGFCEAFNPLYQPWTGGGKHFAFMNQPAAAQKNFASFCSALKPLLAENTDALQQLDAINEGFADVMTDQLQNMWAQKLGLTTFDNKLFEELAELMLLTPVDYTRFFRELSNIPSDITALKATFYNSGVYEPIAMHQQYNVSKEAIEQRFKKWLLQWHECLAKENTNNKTDFLAKVSKNMKAANPKYTLREWLLAPAYQKAASGDYSLIHELQAVMTKPYDEQTKGIEQTYYQQKPIEAFGAGGISHLSCSS